MSAGEGTSSTFRWPYTPTPGSSTPPPTTTPKEGGSELWAFFWLALLNALIIAVSGLAAYWLAHH